MTKRSKKFKVSEKTSYELDRSLDDLYAILNYMRPAGSASEEEMIEKFIVPLGAKPDPHGNYILRIADTDPTTGEECMSPVLWSCHTDSVHSKVGMQKLLIDEKGILSSDGQNCLGADDAAGIWLMRRMIQAKVPGLYIFHRAEEIGGIGSHAIAKDCEKYRNTKITLDKIANGTIKQGKDFDSKEILQGFVDSNSDILDGIKYAIAFDRKGTDSIITYQGVGRCCSDKFAESLALELADSDGFLKFKNDPTGTFTDTASYTSLIPECTNLSVGYYSQHTSIETLSTTFIKKLMESLLQFDWRNLVEERKTTDKERYSRYSSNSTNWHSNYPYDQFERGYYGGEDVKWMYMLIKNNISTIEEILGDFGYDYESLNAEIIKRKQLKALKYKRD